MTPQSKATAVSNDPFPARERRSHFTREEIQIGKMHQNDGYSGETIEALSDPTSRDPMVDVLWHGRVLTVFALDVDVSGTEIAEPEHLTLVARA